MGRLGDSTPVLDLSGRLWRTTRGTRKAGALKKTGLTKTQTVKAADGLLYIPISAFWMDGELFLNSMWKLQSCMVTDGP